MDLDFILYSDRRNKPRWLLSEWRWREKLALTSPSSIVSGLTEPFQKTKFNPRDPNRSQSSLKPAGLFQQMSQFVFIAHVRSRGRFRAAVRRSTPAPFHQTNWFGWRLVLDSPAQHYRRGAERRWSDAQNLPQSCLLKSLEWTDSTGHARRTRGLFLHPSNEGLTLLFTLPVKYYRSFM